MTVDQLQVVVAHPMAVYEGKKKVRNKLIYCNGLSDGINGKIEFNKGKDLHAQNQYKKVRISSPIKKAKKV